MTICMIINDNTHNKSYQLKVNYMNFHINCHTGDLMQVLIHNLNSVPSVIHNLFLIHINIKFKSIKLNH